MSDSSGWPRGRIQWALGTVALLILGTIIGLILHSVLLGLFLAAIVSVGWLVAYEASRGGAPNLHDDDDDGARL